MNTFISKFDSTKGLNDIVGFINDNIKEVKYSDLKSDETLLVIVDMVKGFTSIGNLCSEEIADIINPVLNIYNQSMKNGYEIIAFRDKHTERSVELTFRVEHCISSTETDLIDGLDNVNRVFDKNSTNGFVTDQYMKYIDENKYRYKNIIVVGDCTDICISQYVLTLKAYFNERDIQSRIIIPLCAVDTYDFSIHNRDLLNVFSLYQFIENDIEVVKTIL